MRKLIFVPFLFLLIFIQPLTAKDNNDSSKKDSASSAVFDGLKLRSIGPALTSGRITDFAVNPSDPSEYYVASASGGVWKTTNAGISWIPVFDKQGSYSIGCVTMDPNNHFVIWVGTGENNSQRSVSYGDGVYRSNNGGKSWKNMGLKSSEHIGKIYVDPRNSNIVFVASQGPLWGPGGERGLYKSTDGGETWKAVLTISENTGVNDIVVDPKNLDIMYASSYQRRRHVFTIINGGPESAIYKSTDGGESWKKLTSGLPNVDMGKIGLAVSPVNTDLVFAIIEAADGKGGFFSSSDRGESWQKKSSYTPVSSQYYNEIFCDPENVDRIYSMDTWLHVTDDGGKSFHRLGEKYKHVDNHAMWIDPKNTSHYLVGCDGGIYESYDNGLNWEFKSNLPVTQFYRVAVDNAFPLYFVYGGTQDNFSLGGPSRTTSVSGIVNSDWFITNGGDGFVSKVDPEDPNIIYAESQYGGLVRFDKKSGEVMGIQPQPGKGEESFRWNWDSPLIISPHSHTRLYFAANKIFRSDDRGNSWKEISGDLTRQIDRNKLPIMGKVWGVDAVAKNASTSLYGNIVSLTESPLKDGLLYAGTDDGLINVTEDGGKKWRKIEKVEGVPEMTYVRYLVASNHQVNRIYAVFDNHKESDYKPYIFRSNDAGKSWQSINGNLPMKGTVYSIAEDYVDPDLLFAGTEFGLFFTTDGGNKWTQLKRGLPTIAVRDMAIQKRENDLVLATFGRGFYILDDLSPLRNLKSSLLEKQAEIFPIKDALMYIQTRPIGLKGKGFQGESYFTADNPPFGATFTYYLKEKIKTKKEMRQEAGKKAIKKGKAIVYPTYAELKAEDEEEAPYLLFTISDEDGNVVRKLKAAPASGIKRITWDLRYPLTNPTKLSKSEENIFADGEGGVLAAPGKYSVTLSKCVNGVLTRIAGPMDFNAVTLGSTSLPAEDRAELLAFQKKVSELNRAVLGTVNAAKDLSKKIKYIQVALLNTPDSTYGLMKDAEKIKNKVNKLLQKLTGDKTLISRNENAPITIVSRVQRIINNQWRSTSLPTQTQHDAYKIADEELTPVLNELKNLIEINLKKLQEDMEKAGSPYTPGSIPVWKSN